MAMAVDLIGGVSASQNANLQVAAVSQQDFLRILVTQLSFQDPLKPIDNQAFIAQIAQFTALEQTRQLNDGMNNLLTIQSVTQSIDLIGKTVEVATESGAKVVGKVSTLTFVQGQPRLVVTLGDGNVLTDVTLDKVSVIRA
jgi:flagellar basal-body rod modification protein FlgD